MYHIYEEDYCDCRTYGTPRFKDIYEDYATFNAAMTTSGIPLKITNNSLETLYYLLYARYALSHIATTDTAQFAYQVASTIFMYGPTWEKRIEIQETIRSWSEEELLDGATQINNLSANPGTAPATTSFEVLRTINQQTATRFKKSKLDGYGYLMSLLETDVTEEFIEQFNKHFMSFVGYTHQEAEGGMDEPQTKTVTPTTATQYVQADDGYVLDTVVVNPIPSNYIVPSGTKSITANGSYDISNYETASVNVPETTLETLNVTANGTYTGAYDTVNVNVPEITLTTKNITANGTYNAPANTGFNVINVNVAGGGGTIDYSILKNNATHGGYLYNITLKGNKLLNFETRNDQDITYNYSDTVLTDICYLATSGTPIVMNGSTGSETYDNLPCSYIIITSDLQLYYSSCNYQPPEGPTGLWAIGSSFNGVTLTGNYNSIMNESLYNYFYPDASESNTVTIKFTNGYYIKWTEESSGTSNKTLALYDPMDSVLQSFYDGGNTYSFTFNSDTYTIGSYEYTGISDGGNTSDPFWTNMNNFLLSIFTVS